MSPCGAVFRRLTPESPSALVSVGQYQLECPDYLSHPFKHLREAFGAKKHLIKIDWKTRFVLYGRAKTELQAKLAFDEHLRI